MSWTSHDRLFGWIHSFRFNRNNYAFGGRLGINERPYPAIINKPSLPQVVNNWNTSDTGLVLTFFIAGIFIARRMAFKDPLVESIIQRRGNFKAYHRVATILGMSLALRNSAYRLEGYVPNGLPKKEAELVKYDYTSELINSTFWKYIFESHEKPNIQG